MAEIRNIEQRIEQLETRQKQDKALLARLKARQAQAERKLDTRRKILVGAVVLRKAQSDPAIAAQLTRWLEEGLTASRDRALFPGLSSDSAPKE